MTGPAPGVRRRAGPPAVLAGLLAGLLVVAGSLAGCTAAAEPGRAHRTAERMEGLVSTVVGAVEAYGAQAGVELSGGGTGGFGPCGMGTQHLDRWRARINVDGFAPRVSREAEEERRGLERALEEAGLRVRATDEPTELEVVVPGAYLLVGAPRPLVSAGSGSVQTRTITAVADCERYDRADAAVLGGPERSYDVLGVDSSR